MIGVKRKSLYISYDINTNIRKMRDTQYFNGKLFALCNKEVDEALTQLAKERQISKMYLIDEALRFALKVKYKRHISVMPKQFKLV